MDHDSNRPPPHPPFWRSRFGIGWIVLAAVAGWFLWAEHRAHLLGFLPFAFLLACPLMHVFMHRGHPQYLAFVLILLGFLVQWPTLLTLLMFPILLVMYGRLAVNEEREMERQFGAEYRRYAERTPRFLPVIRRKEGVT